MGIQNNHKKGYKWTKEQFEEKIKEINPNIIVSNFTKTEERIRCKCKKCGYEWNPKPHHLLNGHGCPTCNAIENFKSAKKICVKEKIK